MQYADHADQSGVEKKRGKAFNIRGRKSQKQDTRKPRWRTNLRKRLTACAGPGHAGCGIGLRCVDREEPRGEIGPKIFPDFSWVFDRGPAKEDGQWADWGTCARGVANNMN